METDLRTVLIDLIEKQGVSNFYVGNHGAFDAMAYRVLAELKRQYPQISYTVVLAYLPKRPLPYRPTILPEGFEKVPPAVAILWRNRWMLERSQVVVTAVWRSGGGAAKFQKLAKKMGKQVINLWNFKEWEKQFLSLL